jgi:ElaB/YqjD/DUF883 family membrane-anchored ribosome-binding protein
MDQRSNQDRVSETAAKAGHAASEAIQQGKEVIQDAQAGAASLAQQATDLARQGMAQAGEVVQSAAREAGNQATRAAANLREQGSQAGDFITRYSAEQPVTALLVAAAIGYGLAYLIHRR